MIIHSRLGYKVYPHDHALMTFELVDDKANTIIMTWFEDQGCVEGNDIKAEELYDKYSSAILGK